MGEAPDFGSGHDLTARGFEPRVELSAVGTESASDPLSPLSLPLPNLCIRTLSLSLSVSKINIEKLKKKEKERKEQLEGIKPRLSHVVVAFYAGKPRAFPHESAESLHY